MLAVDTNVLVRVLTADDPRQTARAKTLISSGAIWISNTVFLETAWVLSYFYRFDDAAICQAYRNLLGLANLQAEDLSTIETAISLCGLGLQFTDALHLSCRPPGASFATFDEALIKRARRSGVRDVAKP